MKHRSAVKQKGTADDPQVLAQSSALVTAAPSAGVRRGVAAGGEAGGAAGAGKATVQRAYYVVVRWLDRESTEQVYAIGPHLKHAEAREYAEMFQSTYDYQLDDSRRCRINLHVEVVLAARAPRWHQVWPDDTPVYNVLEVMFPGELRSRLWFMR